MNLQQMLEHPYLDISRSIRTHLSEALQDGTMMNMPLITGTRSGLWRYYTGLLHGEANHEKLA